REVYEIVSLLQEMLFSAASLGSFIKTHHITRASVHFTNLVSAIQANLSHSVNILEDQPTGEEFDPEKVADAHAYFKNMLKELVEKRQLEVSDKREEDPILPQRTQEAQLVMDQLMWLLEISGNLKELVKKVYGKK